MFNKIGNHNMALKYRPDIDGLRAIAVLLVVFNHAGIDFFSGGFVGVDIFFVISGYLISNVIFSQSQNQSFSFKQFYIRRAKRILPALYATLTATAIVGYFVFLPSDYFLFAKSSLSAILFFSNVFFWKNTGGYFSSSAEEMPLLHIWSLSVEEQFYFVWPFLLVFILKIKRSNLKLSIVILLAACSFFVSQYSVKNGSLGAYFLLSSRAWELLVGAVLALWSFNKKHNESVFFSNCLSSTGLVFLLYAALSFTKTSQFPGFNALIPCLGAALVIAAPLYGASLISRILSTRLLVFIGLMSYSVYLWHWPLVSFFYYSRVKNTALIKLSVIVFSLAFGFISWKYIEKVYRKNNLFANKSLLYSTVFLCLLSISCPIVICLTDGFPQRFPFALLTEDDLLAERSRYWGGAATSNAGVKNDEPVKNILIIGNSYAYDLSNALTENNFSGNIKLIMTSHQCFNFGHDPVNPADNQLCADIWQKVLSTPELESIDSIYLHDNWGKINLSALQATLDELRQRTKASMVIFGPKMSFQDGVSHISKRAQIERNISIDDINSFSTKYQTTKLYDDDKELENFFSKSSMENVYYVSALKVQCGDDRQCKILSDAGEYLYFDFNHFTLVGARIFGKKLFEYCPQLF